MKRISLSPLPMCWLSMRFKFVSGIQVQSSCVDQQGLWECVWTGVLVTSWSGSGCWRVSECQTVCTWARWCHKKSSDTEGKETQRKHVEDSWSDFVFHWKRSTYKLSCKWLYSVYMLPLFFDRQIESISSFCFDRLLNWQWQWQGQTDRTLHCCIASAAC